MMGEKFRKSLDRSRVAVLSARTKQEALLELIDLISRGDAKQDISKIKEAIFYREKLMSTGIGLGLAIPHARMDGVCNPIVAVGISREGISDYEAIDNQLVRIVILIVVGKDQQKDYIRMLSYAVSKLKDEKIKERLLFARTEEEIYMIFSEREA